MHELGRVHALWDITNEPSDTWTYDNTEILSITPRKKPKLDFIGSLTIAACLFIPGSMRELFVAQVHLPTWHELVIIP